MNYRHAYHAGNFADCVKHALLLMLLRALSRKPTGYCVLDTHAGPGHYDLHGPEARKTGEWHGGVGRLLKRDHPALDDYRTTIRTLGLYPGSPALIRSALRPQDRLIACELHPDDIHPLRRRFRHDPQVAAHHRDGYEALRALLPPKDARRGLILIDPPYEKPDDFNQCLKAITTIRTRFRAGVIAVWYPIKHRAPIHAFYHALRDAAVADVLACEFLIRPPLDPTRLNGCGMLVVNGPYGTEAEAARLFHALAADLKPEQAAPEAPAIEIRVVRLTEEQA